MRKQHGAIDINQLILLAIAGTMVILLFSQVGPLFQLPVIHADTSGSAVSVSDVEMDALQSLQRAAENLFPTATPRMSPEEEIAAMRENAGLSAAAQAEAEYVPPTAEPSPQLAEPIQTIEQVPPVPTPVQIPVAPELPQYTGQPQMPFWIEEHHQYFHMTPIGAMPCSEIYIEYGGHRAVTQYGSQFQSWVGGLPGDVSLAYANLCDHAMRNGGH